MASPIRGRATLRTAGVLFILSAVPELLDYSSAIALFGGVRGGIAAALYHLAFAALYMLCGVGLWTAKRWGYGAFMATTAVYTIDKIQMLAFSNAFYDYILQQLTITREIISVIPKEQLIPYFALAYLVLLICWWAFALYVHWRRAYFQKGSSA